MSSTSGKGVSTPISAAIMTPPQTAGGAGSMAELERLFDSIDANHDGVVSRAEMEAALGGPGALLAPVPSVLPSRPASSPNSPRGAPVGASPPSLPTVGAPLPSAPMVAQQSQPSFPGQSAPSQLSVGALAAPPQTAPMGASGAPPGTVSWARPPLLPAQVIPPVMRQVRSAPLGSAPGTMRQLLPPGPSSLPARTAFDEDEPPNGFLMGFTPAPSPLMQPPAPSRMNTVESTVGNAANTMGNAAVYSLDAMGKAVLNPVGTMDSAVNTTERAVGRAVNATDRAVGGAVNAMDRAGYYSVDAMGNAVGYTVDAMGKPLDTMSRAVNATDRAVGSAVNAMDRAGYYSVDAMGNAVDYTVDAMGNPLDTMSRAVKATESAAGKAVNTMDRAGYYAVDAMGKAVNATDRAVGKAVNATDRAAGYTVDAMGKAVNATDRAAGYAVDAMGRAIGDIGGFMNVGAGEMAGLYKGDWAALAVKGEDFLRMFPTMFTIFCFLLFTIPIWLTYLTGRDPQVKHWIGSLCSNVLLLPIMYLVVHLVHRYRGRPSKICMFIALIGSCVLILVVADYTYMAAMSHGDLLRAKDCTAETNADKHAVQTQWAQAKAFYSSCIQATAAKGDITYDAAVNLYRIEDCIEYEEEKANHPDWGYLAELEETYACSGWCTHDQPLWTFKAVKDSCSQVVGNVLLTTVRNSMNQVLCYTLCALAICVVGVVFAGKFFRSMDIVW